MDHSALEDRDLESGGTGSEDELSSGSISSNKSARSVFGRLRTDILGFEGYGKDECSSSTYNMSGNSNQALYENKDSLTDKHLEQGIEQLPVTEKKNIKEKRKNSFRKASRPPRPPKGPTLDVSDLKLITEISDLAKKRRARIKRIKALREMKTKIASPSSSSSSSLIGRLAAMVATLLLFIVILFQGILSKHTSSASFKGSPEPAAAAHDLISVRFFNSTPISGGSAPSSILPKSVLLSCLSLFHCFGYVNL
ncbi:hypothetical protein DCAR_0103022 [Daucus carota subsp. sativus]|uniref:Uncharacterized protein n=1 Tax=Daucus carota subsp. sativus TaxID=79200 RepID=A0AAF0W7I1_DAUCS|nr:hypothetical protein DCAR_0103022 [Daucus carota subsp. sativus]